MDLGLRSDDYTRKIDAHVSSLVDAYRNILKKGQVADKLEPHATLQVGSAVATIAVHTNALLDQINELRMALMILENQQNNESDAKGW